MTIAHRIMDGRDERFVLDSWSKSYRESDYAGLIQNSDWFGIMLPQLEKVLHRPRVDVVIAYDPSDTDRVADIYGWICTEHLVNANGGTDQPLVYYAFVKSAYRRRGIAAGLFRAADVDPGRPFLYACRTYVLDEMGAVGRRKRIPYAQFAPMAGRS